MIKRPYEIIKFRTEHARTIDALEQAEDPSILRLGTGALFEGLEVMVHNPALTAWDEGPIMCAGIIYRWPGLWDSWAIVSSRARGRPSLHRMVRDIMIDWEKEYHIRRLQAYVKKHNAEAKKYLAFLEFAPEASLRSFGPRGEDMIVYTRIHNGHRK